MFCISQSHVFSKCLCWLKSKVYVRYLCKIAIKLSNLVTFLLLSTASCYYELTASLVCSPFHSITLSYSPSNSQLVRSLPANGEWEDECCGVAGGVSACPLGCHFRTRSGRPRQLWLLVRSPWVAGQLWFLYQAGTFDTWRKEQGLFLSSVCWYDLYCIGQLAVI